MGGMVNLDLNSQQNSKEKVEFDYREGKVKHYYEIVYDKNGIIVIKSTDSDNVLTASVENSRLNQDVNKINELLTIQEQKLIASNIEEKRVYKIYKITFPYGKVYIGQTIQTIEERFKQELTSAYTKGSKEYNYPYSRALRKYIGEDLTVNEAFKKSKELGIFPELWHVCADQQDANNAERFWIGYYHSQYDEYGYNILEGGLGGGQSPKILPADLLIDGFELGLINPDTALPITKAILLDYLNQIKEDYDIDYQITDHILTNSLRHYFGESMTFEKMRWEKIKNTLIPYLKQGYNPNEIKNRLKIVENIETIKNWINRIVLETDFNSIDIVFSNLIRETILKGKPDYSNILTRLPNVPNNNRERWVLNMKAKLDNSQFNEYVKQVIIGIIKEKIQLNELDLKAEILKFSKTMSQNFINENELNNILNQIDINAIRMQYLGKLEK